MNCMNCNAAVGHESICPKCGSDLKLQKKAIQISDMYYNRGLDKAQIRDLSGAIDLLERSLKYNKRNITARNLLGLICFETGEVVSALSEWIISKNIRPVDNIAAEYIEKLQENPDKLEQINQTVKRYNRALESVKGGNEDIAELMLKKVIDVNPNLIKAYHLLAIIYMKDAQWEKARKVLKKAIAIDRTNDTTLRFIREIKEQTGKETVSENGIEAFGPKQRKTAIGQAFSNIAYRRRQDRKKDRLVVDDEVVETAEDRINQADTISPVAFHETSAFSGLLYIILGIIMGALVIWFLIVPSVKQDANRKAEEKVTELNTVIAKQAATMDEYDATIAGYDANANSAQSQLANAAGRADAMEKMSMGYNAIRSGNVDMAKATLDSINKDVLSVDAQVMLQNLLNDVNGQMYDVYLVQGINFYNNANYEAAIQQLEQARLIQPNEYDCLLYLGNAYRNVANADKALLMYNTIIEQYPNTQRSETALYYVKQIEAGIITDAEIATAAYAAAVAAANAAAAQAAAAQAAQTQTQPAADGAAAQPAADAAAGAVPAQ